MFNKRKGRLIIIFVFIIFFTLGNTLNVIATTSSKIRQQYKQNREQIEKAQKSQDEIRSQMSDIEIEIEDLNTKISDYENEIFDLSNRIDEVTVKINDTENILEKTEKELNQKQELLNKRLVSIYKGGDITYLDVLLDSESIVDFISGYYLMEELVDNDSRLIESIEDTKKRIEESKQNLEKNEKQLKKIKKVQELKKQDLDLSKKEKKKAVQKLSDQDKELQKKIDEMRKEDARIREAIKREQESEKKGKNNSSQSNPGGFIYPVPKAYSTITTFLYYSKTGSHHGAYHGAVDFGTAGINGQPVYAVKSGTVVLKAELNYSYGNYILINHHDGTYTLYAHGQKGSICVREGQKVSQGQQIMKVGSTGNSTGPHLHFEVRVSPGGYSNRVNPLKYLPK